MMEMALSITACLDVAVTIRDSGCTREEFHRLLARITQLICFEMKWRTMEEVPPGNENRAIMRQQQEMELGSNTEAIQVQGSLQLSNSGDVAMDDTKEGGWTKVMEKHGRRVGKAIACAGTTPTTKFKKPLTKRRNMTAPVIASESVADEEEPH